MMPLNLLSNGETAEILKVKASVNSGVKISGKSENYSRLETLGFRIGKNIQMLNSSHENTILVMIDNSRLALSTKLAMCIYVRKI